MNFLEERNKRYEEKRAAVTALKRSAWRIFWKELAGLRVRRAVKLLAMLVLPTSTILKRVVLVDQTNQKTSGPSAGGATQNDTPKGSIISLKNLSPPDRRYF